MAKKAKRARKHSPCSPITCDHGTSGGKNLTTTSSLPPNFEGISTKENARELLGSEEETLGQEVNTDELAKIPLWMSFPELNFRYWSKDSLSKLGSLIGRPLATNKGTQNKTHAKFAKLRIAMDLNKPFPDEEKAAKRMVKEGSATKAQPKLGGGAISQCARGSDTGADCGSRLSGNNLSLEDNPAKTEMIIVRVEEGMKQKLLQITGFQQGIFSGPYS
ncbi:hypothetical protein Cgig2_003303 [Carnegiea gigantea]|uniref:Uncharacterized protein n=1 Tax=Carnegiea gigantea TaxID=171969 RepID=A0A9Q1K3A8_9CARY|nr:hypothetical protein Cgig2_003303 [Carnegiea gigantea]